jgi:hypothetical protein
MSAPPHSVKIFRDHVAVTVTLIRSMPDSVINLDTTATHFHLDTNKFSKKFLLDFDFPEGITVHADKADASLEFGILKISFPIASRPAGAEPKQQQPKPERKRKAESTPKLESAAAAEIAEASSEPAVESAAEPAKKKVKKAKFIDQNAALAMVDAINDNVDDVVEKQEQAAAAKKAAIKEKVQRKLDKKNQKKQFLHSIQAQKKQRMIAKQTYEQDAPRPAAKKQGGKPNRAE